MKLDVDKTKQLINVFARLTPENQEIVLKKACELEIMQSVEYRVKESGKAVNEENVSEQLRACLGAVKPVLKMFDDGNPTQQAALAIAINAMTNGALAKEEEVDFIVRTRQLTIDEFIEKHIPGADIDSAKQWYKEYMSTHTFPKLK